MITFNEYRLIDGVGLAEQINKRQISASEVLECAIARAEEVNPVINAIVSPYYEHARKYIQHHTRQGALGGVPMLLKDLLGELEGFSTGSGTAAHRSEQSTVTSTLYKRYSDLGLVFIGKTNTPEFGLLATTEPVANGPTRNPWNLKKTAGGSSGGSAAAVAAGIVPIASAGDGGGSIRIPASCCGLFGFKPTRGLNPLGPMPESWDGAVSEHVITRSVRDSLVVMRGSMGSDAFSHVPQLIPKDFLANADQPVEEKLKIGFCRKPWIGNQLDTDCDRGLDHAVKVLRNLGHVVEEVSLRLDEDKLISCYSDIYAANVNADISDLVQRYGVSFVRDHVEPLTYFIFQVGKCFSAGEYILSRRRWAEMSAYMNQAYSDFDVLMTPTMAVAPFDLGTMTNSDLEQAMMRFSNRAGISRYASRGLLYHFSKPQLAKVPFTQLANMTGQPAMSVPLYWNEQGLPIGIQFVGKRLDDGLLFKLARQLELAEPWFLKVPCV